MSSKMMSFEVETFYNFDTIKSFGITDKYSAKLRGWQQQMKDVSLKYNMFSIKTNIFMSILGSVIQMTAFCYCLFLLWAHSITYGTMTLFLQQLSAGYTIFSQHENLQSIKELLSAEYELAYFFQHLAPELLHRRLTDGEICNLALCFGGGIRNYLNVHPEKKIKTVILSHRNMAAAWGFKRKILESLDQYIEITDILPVNYKDNFELSQFKNFVEENGIEIDSLSQIATETGISEKNLNRFLDYEGLEGYKKLFK